MVSMMMSAAGPVDAAPVQQQKQDAEIDSLIKQLQADKYDQRKQAAVELYQRGASAVVPLFQTMVDRNAPIEARRKSGIILLELAKNGDDSAKQTVTTELKKIDPKEFARVKENLLDLRMELLGEIHYSYSEAVTRLTQAGCSIRSFGGTTTINFHNWHGTLRDFRCLLAIKNSINMHITTDFGVDHFEILNKLDIRSLTLSQKRKGKLVEEVVLSDPIAKAICKCTSLETLNFGSVTLGEKTLPPIGQLIELKSLYLPTGTTDKTIRELSKLKKLQRLSFSGDCQLDGAGFAALKEIPGLYQLQLNRCVVKTENLKHLAELPALTYLALPPKTTNDAMKYIGKIETLETLLMYDTWVTDLGFSELTTLQDLKRLQVRSTGLTDRSISVMNQMEMLESVYFHQTLIRKQGFDTLQTKNRKMPSGQPYNPQSEPEYKTVQKLIDSGLIIRPLQNSRLEVIFRAGEWQGKSESLMELKDLPVQQISLHMPIDSKMIQSLVSLDSKTPIVLFDDGISPNAVKKLRAHFSDVIDPRPGKPKK